MPGTLLLEPLIVDRLAARHPFYLQRDVLGGGGSMHQAIEEVLDATRSHAAIEIYQEYENMFKSREAVKHVLESAKDR